MVEASKNFDLKSLPDHPHLVILSVKNEQKLLDAQKYLDSKGIRNYGYREPDYNNSLTAVATEPLQDVATRRFLKKFQLLKSREAKVA